MGVQKSKRNRGVRGIRGKHQKARRDQARRFVNAYLNDHPCTMCGNTDIRVLQFHHRDPQQKRHNVRGMVSRGMFVADIMEEIERTEVLCANCHIIHHYNERWQKDVVRKRRLQNAHS